MPPELRKLAGRFTKYAGVGAIGSAGHYATLFFLVEIVGLGAVAASSAGFLVGGIINYLLNYKFTFQSDQSHVATVPTFFTIALGGFFLNGGAMSLFVNQVGLHYVLAQIIASGFVLMWTFLGNQFWTFNQSKRRKSKVETGN